MTEGTERPQRYCSNCGTQARPGDAFCVSCGHHLGDEADTSAELPTMPVVRGPGRQRLSGDGDVRAALHGVATLLLVIAACFAFAYSFVLGLVLVGLLVLTVRASGRDVGAHTVTGQRLLAAFESWWSPNTKTSPGAHHSPVRKGATTASSRAPDSTVQVLDAVVFATEAIVRDLHAVLKRANAVDNAACRAVWWCTKVFAMVVVSCFVLYPILNGLARSDGIWWAFVVMGSLPALLFAVFVYVWYFWRDGPYRRGQHRRPTAEGAGDPTPRPSLMSAYPPQECIDRVENFMVGKGYSVERGGSTATFARQRQINWLVLVALLLLGVLPAILYAAALAAAPVRITLLTTPVNGGTELVIKSDAGEDAAVLEGWIRNKLLAGRPRW